MAALIILSASLLQACSQGPPASTQKLPDYPRASAITERKLDTNNTILNIYRSISFTTTDSHDMVFKFYRDTLLKDGWEVAPFQPDPDALVFHWASPDQPPASYWLDLSTQPGDTGKTQVKVDLRFDPGS